MIDHDTQCFGDCPGCNYADYINDSDYIDEDTLHDMWLEERIYDEK